MKLSKVLPILIALSLVLTACNFQLTVDGQTYLEGDPCTVIDGSGVTSPLCNATATVTASTPVVTDPSSTPSAEESVTPTPTQMAFAGYTLEITSSGEFPIPQGWTYVYCTNSTPELATSNGLQYTESDPLGTGNMWIGFPSPTQNLTTFKVTPELLKKMQDEAQTVALWCQFK